MFDVLSADWTLGVALELQISTSLCDNSTWYQGCVQNLNDETLLLVMCAYSVLPLGNTDIRNSGW